MGKKLIKDSNIKSVFNIKSRTKKEIECESCGTITEVPSDVKSIICSNCVILMVPPPENSKTTKPKEKRPRGWQFRKQYISPSGIMYSFGKEVTQNENNINKD